MRIRLGGVIATGLSLLAGVAQADGKRVLSGDPVIGEREYVRCVACHSPQRNRTGPRHCGLIGRRAGTVAGYSYSKAMKESKIVWDAVALNRFLAAPLKVVPGTKMGYAGVKDDAVRGHLIAYLSSLNDAGGICN